MTVANCLLEMRAADFPAQWEPTLTVSRDALAELFTPGVRSYLSELHPSEAVACGPFVGGSWTELVLLAATGFTLETLDDFTPEVFFNVEKERNRVPEPVYEADPIDKDILEVLAKHGPVKSANHFLEVAASLGYEFGEGKLNRRASYLKEFGKIIPSRGTSYGMKLPE